MTGLTHQNSAAQNATYGDINQSPYQLLPLPVVVVSPVDQVLNTSDGTTDDSFMYSGPTLHMVNPGIPRFFMSHPCISNRKCHIST